MDTNPVSAAEAVVAFTAWLTSVNKPVTVGSGVPVENIAMLAARFMDVNGLRIEPGSKWHERVKTPDAVGEDRFNLVVGASDYVANLIERNRFLEDCHRWVDAEDRWPVCCQDDSELSLPGEPCYLTSKDVLFVDNKHRGTFYGYVRMVKDHPETTEWRSYESEDNEPMLGGFDPFLWCYVAELEQLE